MATYQFRVDQVQIINQKADTNHSDNDFLSIIWSISNTASKSVQPFNKTVRVGGVLHTGDVVPGPFETDPFWIGDNDVLTIALALTNLGSTDAQQQFASAIKITMGVANVLGPIIGGVISGVAAGDPTSGADIGGKISGELGNLVDLIGSIADSLGIHVGPPNCNGEVFSDTWSYTASEIVQAFGQSGNRSYTGPSKDGCGAAPNTKIIFSVAVPQTATGSLLLYRTTGETFVAPASSETQFGPTTLVGGWENDWAQIKPVFYGKPNLLLYRKTDGAAFLAPITGATTVGAAVKIGTWETNWSQIVPLFDGRDLLFYRQSDGAAFVSRVSQAADGTLTIWQTNEIGVWEKDWTQIVPFCAGGIWYLLLYRQTDGRAFTTPLTYNTQIGAWSVGATRQVGVWDKDWSQLTTFVASGVLYLLFYKQSDGLAFAAPINADGTIGAGTKIGNWEQDWAQLAPFQFIQ